MTYSNDIEYNRRVVPTEGDDVVDNLPMKKTDMPSFEYFDGAMLNWVRDLHIFSDTNRGFKEVPVMWYGSERAFQIKKEKQLRDRSGSLILPIITVGRTGYKKNPSVKGIYWANIPAVRDFMGGTITVGKKIKQKKTSEFNNNKTLQKTGQLNYKFTDPDEKPLYVYETQNIHIPVYVETYYEINIWTSYQQQMNEIVRPFLTNAQVGNLNYFTIENMGYRFEAFMDGDFVEDNNVASLNEEDRRYKTKIKVNVLGYIIGEGKNEDQQHVPKRESITKVKFGFESIE